jgi:hypothetical protein
MKKNEITKEYLEKYLEVWKTKESKKKRWVDSINSYKNQVENVKEYIVEIKKIDSLLLDNEEFNNLKQLSKEYSTSFLEYINDDNIKEFLSQDYLSKVSHLYKTTYWGKQVIENNKFKDGNLNIKTFNNLSNGKGPIILYLLIEYTNKLANQDIRESLINFYDNAIKLFRTPHSASSRRGLHFEVCNNNFIAQIKDFLLNAEEGRFENDLNGTYPYRSNDRSKFHKYINENVSKELFGWINLDKIDHDNKKVFAIYNNKVESTLKILMDSNEKLDLESFYELFYKYLEEKNPYPENTSDDLQKILYADQFFQYIHELEIEELNKNVIYYGAPGTGKTYHVTKQLIEFQNVKESNFKIVQFHPSYGYEDFIEGVRPKGLTKDGSINFELVNGEFKQFCIDASKKPKEKFYFIADEINRAELSRTFGELLYCFEYRVQFEDDGTINYNNNKTNLVRTQYSNLIDNLDEKDVEKLSLIVHDSKTYFGIPENIHFIGTMNDIDKSIDSFDMALRRRFIWIRMNCNLEVVQEWLFEKNIHEEISKKYINACQRLNNYIENGLNLGKSYQVGHAYFMKLRIEDDGDNLKEEMLNELWKNNISPLLHEYLRAEYNDNEIEDKLKLAKIEFTLKDNE